MSIPARRRPLAAPFAGAVRRAKSALHPPQSQSVASAL
jgi:hypothetical protein